ncbi:MAG: c-type cytochrome [Bryobacterales bacterium]|nr:c-type cytochrome [Bryobacterales bacterium]
MTKALSFASACALGVAFAFVVAPGRLVSQEAPPTDAPQKSPWVEASDARPAEQAYKNIKVFTGLPANRLERVMKTWKNVLGVECTFCHIKGEWEKDDVEEKEAARFMKKMTDTIATTHFDGKYEVTCYTCHRGDKHPAKNLPVKPR